MMNDETMTHDTETTVCVICVRDSVVYSFAASPHHSFFSLSFFLCIFQNKIILVQILCVYMLQVKYGIDNVRGSVWCQAELTPSQREEIAKAIDEEVYERCYGCKIQGHFLKECPAAALNYSLTQTE